MNERMLELAKQSGMRSPDLFKLTVSHMTTDTLEKFALLIVRECARVAIEKQTENDIEGIVSKNPAKDFAYALIEHFGVEE